KAGEAFEKYIPVNRVFAITEKPLSSCPHLSRNRAWGGHIIRRFPDSSLHVYARLFQGLLQPEPRTLDKFFPKDASSNRITLKRSAHKHAAIEAIQSHLQKRGIRGRMAALIAQATDELILNAVFDAPRGEDLRPTRRDLPRDADFEL